MATETVLIDLKVDTSQVDAAIKKFNDLKQDAENLEVTFSKYSIKFWLFILSVFVAGFAIGAILAK